MFHDIKHINAPKIAGFTTYWIIKLRPISVVDNNLYKTHSEYCTYVNELFAIFISFGRFLVKNEIDTIRLTSNLLTSFLYLLKYRKTSGDNLSMIYELIASASSKL
jgi:hypothetical protein